jgi:hypothetical protein
MQTAGKKHHKKHKKTARKHHAKSNKKIPLGIPIQKIPEMKPMKSLRQTLKNNLENIEKSLKPKEFMDIPEALTKNYGKKDKEFLKSHKELLPQSGGGSDILTYEQNNYQNDPQYSMVDTRHIYNEQQNQTVQGGRRRKTMKHCKKCGKKHGKKCCMKSW